MERGEDREEFCLQILVILVELCSSNVGFEIIIYLSVALCKKPLIVLALMVVCKPNLKAPIDVALRKVPKLLGRL